MGTYEFLKSHFRFEESHCILDEISDPRFLGVLDWGMVVSRGMYGEMGGTWCTLRIDLIERTQNRGRETNFTRRILSLEVRRF